MRTSNRATLGWVLGSRRLFNLMIVAAWRWSMLLHEPVEAGSPQVKDFRCKARSIYHLVALG